MQLRQVVERCGRRRQRVAAFIRPPIHLEAVLPSRAGYELPQAPGTLRGECVRIQPTLHDRHEAELAGQPPRPYLGADVAHGVETTQARFGFRVPWVGRLGLAVAIALVQESQPGRNGLLRSQRRDLARDRRLLDVVVELEAAPEFRQESGRFGLGRRFLLLDVRLGRPVVAGLFRRRRDVDLRRQLDRWRWLLDAPPGNRDQAPKRGSLDCPCAAPSRPARGYPRNPALESRREPSCGVCHLLVKLLAHSVGGLCRLARGKASGLRPMTVLPSTVRGRPRPLGVRYVR